MQTAFKHSDNITVQFLYKIDISLEANEFLKTNETVNKI